MSWVKPMDANTHKEKCIHLSCRRVFYSDLSEEEIHVVAVFYSVQKVRFCREEVLTFNIMIKVIITHMITIIIGQ